MYPSRTEDSRELIGAQDTVETAISGLRAYVRNSKERLLNAAGTIEEDGDRETPNDYKKSKASEDRWGWVRKGCLKRTTTETLMMAAQEQAIRINNIRAKIDNTQ